VQQLVVTIPYQLNCVSLTSHGPGLESCICEHNLWYVVCVVCCVMLQRMLPATGWSSGCYHAFRKQQQSTAASSSNRTDARAACSSRHAAIKQIYVSQFRCAVENQACRSRVAAGSMTLECIKAPRWHQVASGCIRVHRAAASSRNSPRASPFSWYNVACLWEEREGQHLHAWWCSSSRSKQQLQALFPLGFLPDTQ